MFSEEIIQAYMAANSVTREQAITALTIAFASSGFTGNTGSVYAGKVKTTRPGPKNRGTKTVIKDTTKTKDEMYNLFWSDNKVKSQVTLYQNSLNRQSLGEPGGYELWKNIVDTAADIYNGGSGTKLTPLQILTMSASAAKKAATQPAKPTVNIYNVPDTELEADIDEASLAEIGAILSAEEKAKFLPIQKRLMSKGTRTTYRTGPDGAQIAETTPGFTRQMGIEAVSEAIEKAPEYKADVERKDRVDFFKWMTERR
jgi:hypothetical protein